MADKVNPTDIDIENIANAYCRLQLGVEKCSECTGYKNGCCGGLREKTIPIAAVRFAIEAWNKRSGKGGSTMIISNTCVLTLSQLLEWKTKLLQEQKEALKISVNETNETVKAFYINNAEVVQNQLDLLNRLIEQAKVA